MGNPLQNEAALTTEAALLKEPALTGASALSRGVQALRGGDPLNALLAPEAMRIICEGNTHDVRSRRIAMLLAAPEGKGLALFVSAFQRSFGYDDPGKLALRVLCALPPDVRGLREFESGYQEGTLRGIKQGFDEIVDMLAWLRDAAYSFIAAGLDEVFGEQLGKAFVQDLLNGVSPLDGRAAALLESRFPILLDIARICAFFMTLESTLLQFVLSVAENGFMEMLSAAGVKVATVLGESLREFVDKFVGLTNDRKAQGRMIGEIYGRIAFEIALEVATIPVKPASVSARTAKGVKLATTAAGILDSAPEVRKAFRATLSIETTLKAGFKLEEVLREAYMSLHGVNRSYRELGARTRAFNEAYQQLARKSGWLDSGDLLIRLDAHHIIEEEAFKQLAGKPGFKEAFEKLKWASREDMPAVALETEFHIRSPAKLNVQFCMDEVSLEDVKSFTKQLKEYIGPYDKYNTFEELLDKYESFYRIEHKIVRNRKEVTIPILWPLVEDTFKDIRKTLTP